MAFEREMARLAGRLEEIGVSAIYPDFDDAEIMAASATDVEVYKAYKREVSMRHFRKIRDPRTAGVLVANFEKNGRPSYIGPNTFGEIAVAFADGKSIWLLNGVPDQYEDELTAWGAIDLQGDVSAVLRAEGGDQ
jgi:hypothetical protein